MDIKKNISKVTFDKRNLQKKSLQIKNSLDEVVRIIGSKEKNKKKK